MFLRKELINLLNDRLREHLPQDKIDALVQDIKDLDAEWEELDVSHREMGYSMSVNCQDICWLAEQIDEGAVIKMYRKKIPQHS